MTKRNLGCILLVFAAIIWGFAISFQNILGETVGCFTVCFFKGISGFLLIPVAILLKGKYTKKAIISGIICGVIMFVANASQQKGIETSTSGKAAFITATYMLFTAILGTLFFKRKNKSNVWIGVGLAVIGLYLLCVKESFKLQLEDIYLFVGAIGFALQILIVDKDIRVANPVCICSIQLITMAILSGIFMITIEKPTMIQIQEAKWALMYICLLSSGLALTIQFVFQKYVEPTLASLLMSLESVFGAISGFLVLHQVLSIKEIIGCAIIFIAVCIAQK